jgi:hypothetical protein
VKDYVAGWRQRAQEMFVPLVRPPGRARFGLRDRSSKPLSSPSQISRATADAVEILRRERRTQEHIAGELAISRASVSRILRRRGLSLLSSLEPQQPRPSYERKTPGEIIHIDIKKLGRFNAIGHRITGDRRGQSNARGRGEEPGWEFAHVAVDDHSRIPPQPSSQMKERRVPSPSCDRPSPTIEASASTSSAS